MVREEIRGRELVGEKLRRGILVGEREGKSTPPPTWKFGLGQPDGAIIQDLTHSKNILSVRKLGANLWENQPKVNLKVGIMRNKNGPIHHHHHRNQDNVFQAQAQSPLKQPTSRISLRRRQLESSPTQHNLRVEKIGQAQQPLSPASYCSSMKMAPYRAAISPNSSLVSNRKLGESSQGLKTSTELLKVLNRIWTLEEKHALDMSLVKTLRTELGQARAQTQELLQERKIDQNEIENLIEQITELKILRKKDQERITDAVRLVEEKLESELKQRRHSEKHHHKLAKELSETRSSFCNALEELEREKKARTLLEDLCDEFAEGIRDYEQEVRFMKQISSNEDRIRRDKNDCYVLHISEAWLDERGQMKLAAETRNTSEGHPVLDKLCFEIEAFLHEKRRGKNLEKIDEHGCSLNTFCLNEPSSDPRDADEEDESVGIIGGNQSSKRVNASARRQGHFLNFASNRRVKKTAKPKEVVENPKKGGTIQRSDGNLDFRDTIRNSYFDHIEDSFDPSMFMGPSSPVKKWVSRVSSSAAADPEFSSRWPKSVKRNTLKAKLIEERLEGQQSRPSASKSLSKGD
ncbi:hypothetical protein OROGR_030108 [Orobanche gracilis]